MPRRRSPELEKVTLRLYKNDFQRVQQHYRDYSANEVIRQLIHEFANRLEESDSGTE